MGAEDYEGLERFADVDSTGEEAMFVAFLERIEQLPDVVARRHRSYELLDVNDGELVADVGSGLGTAVRELAARGARVIGFDVSAAMLAAARRRSDGAEVEYALADAAELPLENGALGAYRRGRAPRDDEVDPGRQPGLGGPASGLPGCQFVELHPLCKSLVDFVSSK